MDLSTIRIFVSVYETRNIAQSSTDLFISASGVGESLSTLKDHFNDQLFQQYGSELRPTALADRIYPQLKASIDALDATLVAEQEFTPALTDRVFRIALSELGENGWLPRIYNAMHAIAPRARIDSVAIEPHELRDWLTRGTVDLAISPAELPSDFSRVHVKWHEYTVVMSQDNPLATGDLTLEQYSSARRVVVLSDSGISHVEKAHRRAGLVIEPAVTLQHFITLPHLMSDNPDLVAVIPEIIAEGWKEKWPLVHKPLPFDLAPVELLLYKRQVAKPSPELDWIYETVARAISDFPGEFSAL